MHFTLATFIPMIVIFDTAASRHTEQRISMAIPLTKHSPEFVNADKSVDYIALKSHVASVEANLRRGFANYERNTDSAHPAANKHRKRQSEPLTDFSNTLWYGSISVGTPAETFTVAFATGSSDLFLPSYYCDSTCNGRDIYNPILSSTAQDLNASFNISYNDGSSTSGEQYTDTVTVAGYTATTQTLGAALTYSSEFQISTFPADGVMGMGFQSISRLGASPVFQNLIAEGQVSQSVFSFKLSSTGAELYLGGANPSLYTGDFSWSAVTYQGFWQVVMDWIQGNGNTLLSSVNVIFDTGSTVIIGVGSDVASFYSALGGTAVPSFPGYYSFPCASFPVVALSFGGIGFAIAPSALNLGPLSSGSSDCLSGIVANQDASTTLWIIGDVFLQGVYSSFDAGLGQVGFALLA